MKKMVSTLQLLRFNAFDTIFFVEGRPPKRKLLSMYLECDTVKLKHGPCVAGYGENTRRKPDCGHHLCLRCHQNIEWVNAHKPCPVCRRLLLGYYTGPTFLRTHPDSSWQPFTLFLHQTDNASAVF